MIRSAGYINRLSFACVLFALSTVLVAAQQSVRITLADGYSFEVDEVWKQGDELWYRKGGISKRLEGSVKKLTPLTKEEPAPAKTALATAPTAPSATPAAAAEAAPLPTWINLTAGARIRATEVPERPTAPWSRPETDKRFSDRTK